MRAPMKLLVLCMSLTTIEVQAQGHPLTDTLLDHFLTAPAYQLSTPLMLNAYRSDKTLRLSNGRQLVSFYQSQTGQYGYISVSSGRAPKLNLFELDGHELGYALVLKDMKVCLVEGAHEPPKWTGDKLRHSRKGPGNFECSGSTRTSFFQPYSGIPGRLGFYFEDGDTVLYDSDKQRLERIAQLIQRDFKHAKRGPSARIKG